MTSKLTNCADCGEPKGNLSIIDPEKNLCRDCVIKRLRRHEKHSDTLLEFISKIAVAVQIKQTIDAVFLVELTLGDYPHPLQLGYTLNGEKDWYHLNRDEVCALYAKEEISEGIAAYLLDVEIVHFRAIFQESSYAIAYYGYDPKSI